VSLFADIDVMGQRGAFRLHVRHPGKAYLVRVLHEGVSYDQRAFAGDDLSIQVFDAAPIMIPPSMKFSSRSPAFRLLPTGRSDYQVQTANQLKAGEGPGFQVSGAGVLPALGDQAKSQAGTLPLTIPRPPAPDSDRALWSSFGRVDPQLQQTYSHSQSLVLGGLTAVLLGVCALLVWRARRTRRTYAARTTVPRAEGAQGLGPF